MDFGSLYSMAFSRFRDAYMYKSPRFNGALNLGLLYLACSGIVISTMRSAQSARASPASARIAAETAAFFNEHTRLAMGTRRMSGLA